jgi:hypothetical protein
LGDLLLLKAAGDRMQMPGYECSINISIGRKIIDWTVVIANIQDEMLLRMDFLHYHKVNIDMGKATIKMDNDEIKYTMVQRDSDKPYSVSRVTLAKRIVILPSSEVDIPIHFKSEKRALFCLSYLNNSKGLIIADACLSPDSKVLSVMNWSEMYIMLKKRHFVRDS